MNDDRIRRLVLFVAGVLAAAGIVVAALSWFFEDSRSPAGWYVVGAALVAGGAVVALDGRKWLRALLARMKSESAHADEPWLWREDWAARSAQEKRKSSNAALAVAVVYVVSLLPFVPEMTAEEPNLLDLVLAVFAVPVAAWASLRYRRQQKQGGSICRLSAVPIVPGSSARGVVETPFANIEGAVKLTLECLGVPTDSSRRQEVVLWHAESSVPRESLGHGIKGLTVPFSIAVPRGAKTTHITAGSDPIEWRLTVRAPLQGLDYDAKFELPVFDPSSRKHEEAIALPLAPRELEAQRWRKLLNDRLQH